MNKLSCMDVVRDTLDFLVQTYRDKALDTFTRGLRGNLSLHLGRNQRIFRKHLTKRQTPGYQNRKFIPIMDTNTIFGKKPSVQLEQSEVHPNYKEISIWRQKEEPTLVTYSIKINYLIMKTRSYQH